jgi:hypothetical protein
MIVRLHRRSCYEEFKHRSIETLAVSTANHRRENGSDSKPLNKAN